jgi:radical SAM superfamily enzyme YgiQ (UPF0313 family)
MAQGPKGAKIVLTASEIEMCTFKDDPFGAFAGSFLLIPNFLKPRFYPRGENLPDGQVKLAPYGLRKVEAMLTNNGFKESDVAVVQPDMLDQFIGPNTRVVGVSSMDPLGIAYVSLTYSNLFAFGNEPNNRAEFRNLLTKSPIAEAHRRGQVKVIVGGAGAWQVAGQATRDALGIDCVITGEAGPEMVDIFHRAVKGEPIPPTAVGGRIDTVADTPLIQHGAIHGAVEITRGCGRGCQFCAPTLRHRLSLPLDRIVHEARLNAAAGNQMLILATEDLFLYDIKSPQFLPNRQSVVKLIRSLAAIPGIKYIQPAHIALAPVLADPKCVEQVAETLITKARYTRFRRRYITAEAGVETGSVRLFKQRMAGKCLPFKPEEWPNVVTQAIGILNDNTWYPLTTWLVGLPGEREEDVLATLELLDRIKDLKAFVTPLLWVPLRPAILHEGTRPQMEALTDLQWEFFTRAWKYNLDVWRPPLKVNSPKQLATRIGLPIAGSLAYFFSARRTPAAHMFKELLFHSFGKSFFGPG